jgi:hypothetical protein
LFRPKHSYSGSVFGMAHAEDCRRPTQILKGRARRAIIAENWICQSRRSVHALHGLSPRRRFVTYIPAWLRLDMKGSVINDLWSEAANPYTQNPTAGAALR